MTEIVVVGLDTTSVRSEELVALTEMTTLSFVASGVTVTKAGVVPTEYYFV